MDENVRPDVFDRFMCLPGLRLLEPFYRRNKDILLYLFFGFLAFLVSIGSYATLTMVFDLNELVANVISWILAVFFAFFTNRVWVFHAPSGTCGAFARQLLSFFAGRAATLVVEEGIILAFITIPMC